MEVLRSSKTSVLIRNTRPNIPGDGILRSCCYFQKLSGSGFHSVHCSRDVADRMQVLCSTHVRLLQQVPSSTLTHTPYYIRASVLGFDVYVRDAHLC
jgi:hypothetical protein